jgi:pimeloyl-ACP methyl ester carboxylesterase
VPLSEPTARANVAYAGHFAHAIEGESAVAIASHFALTSAAMEPPAAAFREAGTGDSVVCLHSSASSSGQWRPLVDRLASRYRVLTPDLYGYGQSPGWPTDRPLTLGDEAALLEPVFRAAGDHFHLVGHSYGAATALVAALARPERVLSLTLYEPVLIAVLMQEDPDQPAAREIASVRDDTSAAVERDELGAAGARFVDYWMGAGSWAATPEKRRAVIAATMPKIRAEWHAIFTEPTPLAAFAQLAIPTCYLIGATTPEAPRGVARLLTGTLPQVSVVELAGIGHMGPVTHGHQVNVEIEAHLARVSAA